MPSFYGTLPVARKTITAVTTGAGLNITTGANLSEAAGTIVTWVADYGDNPGAFTGKRDACYACGLEFPVSKMRYWRGNGYGVPCGCYTDIARLIRQERGTVVTPSGEEEEHIPLIVDGPS